MVSCRGPQAIACLACPFATPLITQHPAQLLVQALVISRTGLLQCSSSWTSIQHNQTSTNDSECRSGMTGLQASPRRAHVHLSLSPCTGSRLQLTSSSRHWCLHIKQPQVSNPPYFHSLMTIYIPSRSLRSASEQRLVVSSQRGTKSLSRTFSFTVPGWWNELISLYHPYPECWIPDDFQATPENSSLPSSLDFCFFIRKKKNTLLSFLNLSLSS